MTRESLARKFHPAGFDQPEGSRQNYVRPRPELQETFEKWIEGLPEKLVGWDDSDEQYEMACEAIKSLGEIPYREANSLLFDFDPRTDKQKRIGLFISACYTHAPENIISFDLDAPHIWYIGYRLEENKVLVNNGEVGNLAGARSFGLLVDNGKAGSLFGRDASGAIIFLQELKCYGDFRHTRVIFPHFTCDFHELKDYLEELREVVRGLKYDESAERFIKRYSTSGERIWPEIEEILKREGSEV